MVRKTLTMTSKQKGFSNKKLIIIISTVIIIICVITFFVYIRIQAKNKTQTLQKQQQKTTQENSNTSSTSNSTCSTDQTMYVTPSVGVNLRGDKSTTAALILTIPYGTQVSAGCSDGTWSKVAFQGQAGYVQSQYLSKDNPSVFIIKEFGIKLNVGGDIPDLVYVYNASDVNHPYTKFTTKSLLAADGKCNADFGPVGALTYSTVAPADQPSGSPGDGTFIKKLGSKYLYFSGPQAYCSPSASTQALAAKQLNALKVAANSAQLTQ